uniref:Uncharacterized protein n=1 Tax=Romanomermis culicivorax TaxID=13658 RepID=A0A915K666_ROMCU
MISPWSKSGTNLSMNSSTARPALTRSMTRRGDFRDETKSGKDLAPMIFVPFASLSKNSSTFDTLAVKNSLEGHRPSSATKVPNSTTCSSTSSPFRLRTIFMYFKALLAVSAFVPKCSNSSCVVGTQKGSTPITCK